MSVSIEKQRQAEYAVFKHNYNLQPKAFEISLFYILVVSYSTSSILTVKSPSGTIDNNSTEFFANIRKFFGY